MLKYNNTTHKRIATAATSLMTMLLMVGCSTDIVYTDSQDIDRDGWSVNTVAQFEAEVESGVYDIDLLVQSSANYKYQNLWLFVETAIGDSVVRTDTIEGFLSDNYGRRLGQGIGSVRTDYIILSDSIQLIDTTYTFRIRHGMRAEQLEGVSQIGITLYREK